MRARRLIPGLFACRIFQISRFPPSRSALILYHRQDTQKTCSKGRRF